MGFIKFEVMQGNYPPNPGGQTNSKACSRPNPPWWCEEQQVDVSFLDGYLLLTAMVIALFLTLSKKNKRGKQ